MNDYAIRKAAPEDAEAILAFTKQVGSETDNLSFGEEGLPFTVESEASYLQYVWNHPCDAYLTVWKEEKLVATGSLSSFPRRFAHRAGLGICVLKSEWNKGVGSLLMENLIDYAKSHGIELINLEVRSDNPSAIHLYEKYGFTRYGVSPAFGKINGVYFDCDLMVLDLRNE